MINSFHKDHSDKLIITFSTINMALQMTESTTKLTKPTAKQKHSCLTKNKVNKRAKN